MPRILLVEDDPTCAEFVTRFLQMNLFDVVGASDGPAGVGLAKSAKPDLILMDWMVPLRGDGEKATREIRACAGLATVPIIALSALGMPQEVREMYEAGCTDIMTKPINLKQMLGKITNLLAAGTQT